MKKERSRKSAELYDNIGETPILCLKCGSQSPEEARVCLQCGEDISTLNGTAISTKNVKRARKGSGKGLIAFAVLGACACALIGFAVVTEMVEDQPQKPTEVTGAPVVYSGRMATPTPAPTPFWKPESYEIDIKALALQPDQMWSQPLRVQNDWRNARLVGKFTAQGGEKNDIEAIVTNEDGLIKWQKNYLFRPKVWYKSGRVTEDAINAPLPSGQSYFIFDNRFSPSSNKTIRFNLRVEYERLAQP